MKDFYESLEKVIEDEEGKKIEELDVETLREMKRLWFEGSEKFIRRLDQLIWEKETKEGH